VNKNARTIVGLAIIALGVVFLLGTVFRVNVWAFCWPFALIAVGVWLLIRPSMVGPGTRIEQRVLGDVRREGAWDVQDEEFWIGVGNLRLDMTKAALPAGETKIRAFGFVGDLDLILPQDVGVSVSSWAFVTDGTVFGKKEESFVVPLQVASEGYEAAEYKLQVETYFFVSELTIERTQPYGA
jgi:lia operon protein LiaF